MVCQGLFEYWLLSENNTYGKTPSSFKWSLRQRKGQINFPVGPWYRNNSVLDECVTACHCLESRLTKFSCCQPRERSAARRMGDISYGLPDKCSPTSYISAPTLPETASITPQRYPARCFARSIYNQSCIQPDLRAKCFNKRNLWFYRRWNNRPESQPMVPAVLHVCLF